MSSSNPYVPPLSALQTGNDHPGRHWAWKMYWGIVVALYLGMCGWIFIDPESYEAETADYIDLGVYLVVNLGLSGFCFLKRIGRQEWWRLFFVLMVLWDGYFYVQDEDMREIASEGVGMLVVYMIMVAIVLIPQYIAIYRYAFREQELWKGVPG